MAVLVGNYNPEVFNTVPNFHDAIETLNRFDINPILKTIGKVFVKHGVYEKYALVSAHRHFDLNPNEILVESCSSDGTSTLAFPWEFKGKEVTSTPGVNNNLSELKKGKFVQPQTWIFGEHGEVQPFEFHFTDDVHDAEPPPFEFVAELFAKLKQLGLEKIFGLGLRNEKVGWESTNVDTKTNIVKFDEFPTQKNGANKLVNVQWAFNQNGDFIENRWCIWVIIDGVKVHQEI